MFNQRHICAYTKTHDAFLCPALCSTRPPSACRLSWDPRAAATAQVLLAFGANPKAKTVDGKLPLASGPFQPNCAAKYSDGSDCPQTCKVLRDGITAAQKAAIKGGKVPSLEPSPAKGPVPRCCKDANLKKGQDAGLSLCCI